MKIKAKKINEKEFKEFGLYINMYTNTSDIMHYSCEAFEDHMTKRPLIDTQGHLGLTVGNAAPYKIISMEKHDHTQEALFCMQEPVVLCVAKSHNELPPQTADILAFILEPGDVAVIDRNIWHDACHGVNKKSSYYYLASRGEQLAEWIKVEGEELIIEV